MSPASGFRARAAVALAVVASLALHDVPVRVAEFVAFERNVLRWRAAALPVLSEPGAGADVLPIVVLHMIRLLRDARADSFRYSPAIAESEGVRQRLIEGAYPIRARAAAPHYLSIAQEPLPAGCESVARDGDLVLAACR